MVVRNWTVVLVVTWSLLPLLLGESVQAEDTKSSTEKMVIIGISVADMTGDDLKLVGGADHASSRAGILGGIGLQIPVGDFFFIRPELLYVQRGLKLEDVGEPASHDMKFTMHYLELPLMVGSQWSVGSRSRLSLTLGPTASLLLSSVISVDSPPGAAQPAGEYGVYNARRFDFGLAFGAGAGIPVGEQLMTLSVRYSFSLGSAFSDLDPDADVPNDEIPFFDDDTYEGFDWKHRVISVTMAYHF